jgi:hypothetical protein
LNGKRPGVTCRAGFGAEPPHLRRRGLRAWMSICG